MDSKINHSSEAEAVKLLQKVYRNQDLIYQLPLHQFRVIDEIACKELFRIQGLASITIAENPNHKYPDGIQEIDDKITYWQFEKFERFNKNGLEIPYKLLNKFQTKLYEVCQKLYFSKNQKTDFLNESDLVNKNLIQIERLQTLAKKYCKKPNSQSTFEEVFFILKMAEDFKHQKNYAALIRLIQSHKDCPSSIIDSNESKKHAKRQKKLIEFYDKESGNKRK